MEKSQMVFNNTKILSVLVLLLLTLALHLSLPFNPQTQAVHAYATTGFPHVQGAQILDGNNQPLLLRGAMMESSFAYIDEWNAGQDPTKILNTTTFTAMRSWGMNALRINISQWVQQADTTGTYMQKLNQVVNQASQVGLYIIIDFHDDAESGATGVYADGMLHQTSLSWWKTIAKHFKKNTNVMFDLLNEPQYPDWCSWHYGGNAQGRCTSGITNPDIVGFVDVIAAIRSVGAQQIVVVEPGKAGGKKAEDAGWATFDPTKMTDPNVVYSRHEYQNVISGDPSTWDKTWGVLLNHYPIYYGEWAVLSNPAIPFHCTGLTSENADQITNTFLQYLTSRNANWTYWDFEPNRLITDFTTFAPTNFQSDAPWSCPNAIHGGPGREIQSFLQGHSGGTMTLAPGEAESPFAAGRAQGIARTGVINHARTMPTLRCSAQPSIVGAMPCARPASPQACGAWNAITSPNIISSDYLTSISAVSGSDAWSVGYYFLATPSVDTLIEHWDGSAWSIVSSPSPGTSFNYLQGVAAVASNDVWAVGSYLPTRLPSQTLIEHWDGTTWSVVPSSGVTSKDNYLNRVVAISANDIWAVGYTSDSSNVSQALIEHWNGKSWRIIPSPNVGSGSNYLKDITAIATNDVWAVGNYYPAGSNVSQPLIEHWNGKRWSIVTGLNVGTLGSFLSGVTAASTNDVWAVGSSIQSGTPSNFPRTLIGHWNGTTWSIVSSPNVGSSWNLLHSVVALSPNNVWAVGDYQQASSMTAPYLSLIEHWDGTQWNTVFSPNPGSLYNYPNAVTQIPATSQLWLSGNFASTSSPSLTLTEFYC